MDEAVWQKHVDQDIQQSKDICMIKLALFGDPSKPETVRIALAPTQARLNAWMDGICRLGKLSTWAVGICASVAVFAKSVGWI